MKLDCAAMTCADVLSHQGKHRGAVNSKRENVDLSPLSRTKASQVDGAERRVGFRSAHRISEAVGERCKRKVFLILDNLRVHHAKLVKAWLAKHQTRLKYFICRVTA